MNEEVQKMKLFVIYILKSLVKMAFFTFSAFGGLYVGYLLNHGMEIYFRKQRKQIANRGKLIAYMNRHYYAVFKKRKKHVKQRNEKWLYEKCYNYAKHCDELDVKTAIAYLTSDIKQREAFSVLIAICVGFSTSIVGSYADVFALYICGFKSTIELNEEQLRLFNEINTGLQTTFILIWAVILLFLLTNFQNTIKKQQYLLCILEDAYR